MTCAALRGPGWMPAASIATPLGHSRHFLFSHFGKRDFRFIRAVHSGNSSMALKAGNFAHRSLAISMPHGALDRHTLPFQTTSNSLKTLIRASARSTQICTSSTAASRRT